MNAFQSFDPSLTPTPAEVRLQRRAATGSPWGTLLLRAWHVHRRHPIVLAIGYLLIAAHLFLVWSQPASAQALLFAVRAGAFVLAGAVVLRHALGARGLGAFRWSLFVFYFAIMAGRFTVAAYDIYAASRHPFPGELLSSLAFTVALIALTLPSTNERRGERIVDGVVASSLCALRILIVQQGTPVFKTQWSLLTFYVLSAALAWIVAQLAYSSATGRDKPFFRLATWYWAITTVTTLLIDHVGILTFHQPSTAIWSFAATFGLVFFVKLALDALDFPYRLPRRSSRNILVQSLLPFTMSVVVIVLGALLMRGHAVYAICAIAVGVGAFFARTLLLVLRLREEAETLTRRNAELVELAHCDTLTGLANRRSFELALSSAIAHTADPTHSAVLALFDVDGFKGANDTHGHPFGDTCLVAIADTLRAQLPTRRSGVFRLGGDEFAAVWFGMDTAAATHLAAHLCHRVTRLKLKSSPGRTLSLSIGLVPVTADASSQTLLHQADVALYRAKQSGGNCVESFDPATVVPSTDRDHRLRDIHPRREN